MEKGKFILGMMVNGLLLNEYYATFGSAFMALQEIVREYESEGWLVRDNGEYARMIGDGFDIVCQIDEVAA